MGHAAKIPDNICDVTDEIEAAITLKRPIKIFLDDGSTRMGMPKDLYAENHEDFLRLEDHVPVPVTRITRVEKI